MSWISAIFTAFSGKKSEPSEIKKKLANSREDISLSTDELELYTKDIERRVQKMTKELRTIYGRYGITFTGFKSFKSAFSAIRSSLKDNNDEAYNNLIKSDSGITSEMKRHLSLIRMAASQDGTKVMDKINSDPRMKERFGKIFGRRDVATETTDGIYHQLWSELHRVSEYLIIQKDKVYH